ncbi:MAG: hypothetical protein GY711_28975 [bacterium]|nr:hypothetical protein [bacterium]
MNCFVSLALAALTLGSIASAQTTWYVDTAATPGGDGSAATPFVAIQDGIDAAAVDAGDVVLVAPGVYSESIDFVGKNIRVERWGAVGTASIAPSSGRGVTIGAPDWGLSQVLANFEITGGDAEASGRGGGLHVSGASPHIDSCNFIGNTATTRGAGAFIEAGSSCLIENCLFEGNASLDLFGLRGGGIHASAGVVIRDSMFINNRAANGGGAAGNAQFEDCTFQGNVAAGNGAGAYGIEGVRCQIVGNVAGIFSVGVGGSGGGAYISSLEDSTISGNGAFGDGGGALLCSLTGCVVSGNDALGTDGSATGDGGGASRCTLVDCVLSNNFCGRGGGTYRGTATGTLYLGNFSGGNGNEAFDTDLARCMFRGASASLSVVQDGSVESCVFWDNEITGSGSVVRGTNVSNSIVRNNQGSLFGAGVAVTYSNVEGGAAGTGNIDAPALFWDPDGAQPDFHLLPGSPCIDAGDPNAPADPDGTVADMGAFPFDATHCGPGCDGPIGTSYCGPANANSTGGPAVLAAVGSLDVTNATVVLTATGVPAGRFGYFLMSQSQDFVPLFGGSQGNLCLGTPQVRFSQEILTARPDDSMAFRPDFANLPQGTVFQAGDTWNFQVWFRDQNPGQTSNTSQGLSVTFV